MSKQNPMISVSEYRQLILDKLTDVTTKGAKPTKSQKSLASYVEALRLLREGGTIIEVGTGASAKYFLKEYAPKPFDATQFAAEVVSALQKSGTKGCTKSALLGKSKKDQQDKLQVLRSLFEKQQIVLISQGGKDLYFHPDHAPKPFDSAQFAEEVVSALQKSGTKGCSKSTLLGKSTKDQQDKLQVLWSLIEKQQLISVSQGDKDLYFHPDHVPKSVSLESVYKKVKEQFSDWETGRLVSPSNLAQAEKNLLKTEKKYFKDSIQRLISDGVWVKYFAKSLVKGKEKEEIFYLAHKNAEQKSQTEEMDKKTIIRAYNQLVDEKKMSYVFISDLANRSNVEIDTIKPYLKMLWEQGLAHFDVYDWSLSSEEIRSGCIEINGRRQLQVKLEV